MSLQVYESTAPSRGSTETVLERRGFGFETGSTLVLFKEPFLHRIREEVQKPENLYGPRKEEAEPSLTAVCQQRDPGIQKDLLLWRN